MNFKDAAAPLLLMWKRQVSNKKNTLRELQRFKDTWKEVVRTKTPELTSLERTDLLDWIDTNFVVTHEEVDPLDAIVQITQKYAPTEACNADGIESQQLAFLRILSQVYKLGVCNIQNIDLTINTEKDVVEKIAIYRNVNQNLRQVIGSCTKSGQQVIVIPLGLLYQPLFTGHANMLIVNTVRKTVERFEPHGSATIVGRDWTSVIDDTLTGFIDLHMPPGYSYVPPIVVCAMNQTGPQADSKHSAKCKDDPERGFCLVWSTIYAHIRMISPTSSYDEVYKMLSKMAADDKFVRRYVTMMEATLEAHKGQLTNNDTIVYSPIAVAAPNVKTVDNLYGL